MAELVRRTLGDFAMPDIMGNFGGIVAPSIANNNFEIKPSIIHMVQNNLEVYKERIHILIYWLFSMCVLPSRSME